MATIKKDDLVEYENYWEIDNFGTAVVVEVADTIFEPAKHREPDEIEYTLKDLESGEVFEVNSVDYFIEKK